MQRDLEQGKWVTISLHYFVLSYFVLCYHAVLKTLHVSLFNTYLFKIGGSSLVGPVAKTFWPLSHRILVL